MSSRSFPRDAALGNSKFETYKLSALAASSSSSFALPGAAVTQARVQHGKTTLSAREVGSRIRHDHLHLCWGGWIGWVDEEWEVWAAKLSPVSCCWPRPRDPAAPAGADPPSPFCAPPSPPRRTTSRRSSRR